MGKSKIIKKTYREKLFTLTLQPLDIVAGKFWVHLSGVPCLPLAACAGTAGWRGRSSATVGGWLVDRDIMAQDAQINWNQLDSFILG